MKRELFGAVVALIAVCTLGFSSKQDTLVDTSAYVSTTPNSLPADQEPQAAAAELAASPADGVLRAVEELAARMDAEFAAMRRERDDMQGSVDRLALLSANEDVAELEKKVERLEGLIPKEEPVKEEPKVEVKAEPPKAEEPAGQWVTEPVYGKECYIGADGRQYCRQVQTSTRRVWMPRTVAGQAVKTVLGAICPCGCPGCDPELCTCLQATLSPPAVVLSTPIVTQRASYTPFVTMTPYRARTPVFTRRCGPVRRLLGWCR